MTSPIWLAPGRRRSVQTSMVATATGYRVPASTGAACNLCECPCSRSLLAGPRGRLAARSPPPLCTATFPPQPVMTRRTLPTSCPSGRGSPFSRRARFLGCARVWVQPGTCTPRSRVPPRSARPGPCRCHPPHSSGRFQAPNHRSRLAVTRRAAQRAGRTWREEGSGRASRGIHYWSAFTRLASWPVEMGRPLYGWGSRQGWQTPAFRPLVASAHRNASQRAACALMHRYGSIRRPPLDSSYQLLPGQSPPCPPARSEVYPGSHLSFPDPGHWTGPGEEKPGRTGRRKQLRHWREMPSCGGLLLCTSPGSPDPG